MNYITSGSVHVHFVGICIYIPLHLCHQSPPKVYSQNRKANFYPVSYPSGRNAPIGTTNKTVRPIFDWIKIGEVMNFRSLWISPLGAYCILHVT